MFCRTCGAEIADDAVVCVKCGRPTAAFPMYPMPPMQPMQPMQQPQESSDGLFVAGLITAILLPLVGLILGIILLVKGKTGRGAGVLALSVLFWAVWAAALAAGG